LRTGSNCAAQQAPANEHYQELALVAARRFGLCTTIKTEIQNDDHYLLGMLRAQLNH
jgi:hypothetical protein